MLVDTETGKTKMVKDGECIICNGPAQVGAFGIPFCTACIDLSDDEMAERINWD